MRAIELGLNLLGIAGAGFGAIKAADILQVRAKHQIADALVFPPAGQAIEQHDSLGILDGGEIDLDGYCKHLGYNGVRLDPTQQNVNGWGCLRSDGTQAGMDLYDACNWQYGGARPYPEYSDYKDPNSWFCSPEDLSSPVRIEVPSGPNLEEPLTSVEGPCPDFDVNAETIYIFEENGHTWIRAYPSFSAKIIGEALTNQHFRGGIEYTCSDGYTWEHVERLGDGTIGWIIDYTVLPTKQPTIVPQPIPEQSPEQAEETWCSRELDASDLGDGYFWDRNYVVELKVPFYPGDDAIIYFNDKKLHLKYHGYFDGSNRWGVSTFWTFFHWSWQDDNRWRIEFRCTET